MCFLHGVSKSVQQLEGVELIANPHWAGRQIHSTRGIQIAEGENWTSISVLIQQPEKGNKREMCTCDLHFLYFWFYNR